ncbi:MAG: YggT family protein [Firmicutes bacterium]|jgi:uncharacterized membrane protein|nr:YggT family protein [Bacillota bacterium]
MEETNVTEQRTETVIDQGNTVQKTTALETTANYPRQVLIARIIQYVFGVLLVLLAFRFVLGVLGANPLNGFASFIYSVTGPFTAPFFSLFGYTSSTGVYHLEIYTLVAMAVYALVAWGLAKIVTINRAQTLR